MTKRTCPNCGFINAGNGDFCGNCGHLLAESLANDVSGYPAGLCPHCGMENPNGATFCGSCGAPLIAGQSPPEERPRPVGRYLLPLVLIAGLIFLGAVAAFFLLPRLAQDRSSASLPDDPPSKTEELAIATGSGENAPDAAISVTTDVSEASPLIAMGTSVPTVTPFPTGTLRPTPTPLPTLTPQPATPLPPPTSIPLPTAMPPTAMPPTAMPPTAMPPTSPPPVACQQTPGDRWGPTLWDRYQDELGCAVTGEIHPNSAYQYYQYGIMVWREVPDLVYVLYNNGTFDVFPADGPDGYYVSDWQKGSFGYLWSNNATVRERVGQPEAAEFNTTNFAVQDFAGGTIFYFLENDARNYVLFKGNGTWVSTQQ